MKFSKIIDANKQPFQAYLIDRFDESSSILLNLKKPLSAHSETVVCSQNATRQGESAMVFSFGVKMKSTTVLFPNPNNYETILLQNVSARNSADKVYLVGCIECKSEFLVSRNRIMTAKLRKRKGIFCSHVCSMENTIKHLNRQRKVNITCLQCGVNFLAIPTTKKGARQFCSASCSSMHKVLHWKVPPKRSKIEIWIESKLSILFPDLEILYNDKTAIQHELDIFIPSLNLAIEINGIFHYQPIFTEKQFLRVQETDLVKVNLCASKGITLMVLDVSKLKYMIGRNAQPYLDKIVEAIKQHGY